mmetsp:Transcript_816/g.1561  ORF Transcript_816/g.1561 Transcript_816/m.1561 type:complete len:429 (-) Transcript_816:104-1390(-)
MKRIKTMTAATRGIHRKIVGYCRKTHKYPSLFVDSTLIGSYEATSLQTHVSLQSEPSHWHNLGSRENINSIGYSSNRQFSTASAYNHQSVDIKQRTRQILSHALQRVHVEGWTDEAIASGTLDAGFPPSYIGQASPSTSLFGSADLVAFFMEECNINLKQQLAELVENEKESKNATTLTISPADYASRIYKALQIRLSMVTPFVASQKWHEGMAIGALPQNAYRTSQQLDEMANIVLEYVLGASEDGVTSLAGISQRTAIIAAYASSELHLLSDGNNGTLSGSSVSLSGERYHATWSFLRVRCEEAAKMLDQSSSVLIPIMNGVPLPNLNHMAAASAVAASFAGAALSMAAPTAASLVGYALPKAMEAVSPLQNAITGGVGAVAGGYGGLNGKGGRDGTSPSDYQGEDLPPFDLEEEIFPVSGGVKSA